MPERLPAAVRAEIEKMVLAISRKQLTQEQAMRHIARFCLDAHTEAEPFGWRLVPIEPTDTMLACGKGAINDMNDGAVVYVRHALACYKSMLRAVPEVPHAVPAEADHG